MKRIRPRAKTTKVKSLKTGMLRKLRNSPDKEDRETLRTLRFTEKQRKIISEQDDINKRVSWRAGASANLWRKKGHDAAARAQEDIKLDADLALKDGARRRGRYLNEGKTALRLAKERHSGVGHLIKTVLRTITGKRAYWMRPENAKRHPHKA